MVSAAPRSARIPPVIVVLRRSFRLPEWRGTNDEVESMVAGGCNSGGPGAASDRTENLGRSGAGRLGDADRGSGHTAGPFHRCGILCRACGESEDLPRLPPRSRTPRLLGVVTETKAGAADRRPEIAHARRLDQGRRS